MRHFFIFLLLVFVGIQSNAKSFRDSLLAELKNSPKNQEKSILFNRIAHDVRDSNLDSAIFYSRKGLDLATDIGYPLGIAENAASLGDFYVQYDSLDKAKEKYILSIVYFKQINKEYDLASLLKIVGNIYLSQSNYSEALLFYKNSLVVSERNNYTDILPHIYNNSGLIYQHLKENQKALTNYQKAYEGFKKLGLNEEVANAVSNIANIYLADGNDSLALDYYDEALRIFKEAGNFIDASSIYIYLGNHEYEKENYTKALEYYTTSNQLYNDQKIEYVGPKSYILVQILGNLGRVSYQFGEKLQAIDYLEKSLSIAQQNHYLTWVELNTYELFKIYEDEGNYKMALDYFKLYEESGDQILSESSIRKITQLEMQFEFDEKMKEKELEDALKEAAQQKREFRYILFIVLGVFISILAILLFLFQRNKTAKVELKRKNLRLEHDKLQQELEHRNRELATNVMFLLKKNEFITHTAEKLAGMKKQFKEENKRVIQNVIRDLLQNTSKDVWKEFEVRFQEVHSEFYNNLNEKYPDLTPNEKKICAFLRLNMSTKDISAITYQSVRSIDMARFRLRKKIGLETDENLVTFLAQV
jgi:tetratricopeptide (TPR) repeat protein